MPPSTTSTNIPITAYERKWFSLSKPYWKEANKATRCQFQDCGVVFSFFNSKINCHRCGIVLCKSCVASRVMEELFNDDDVPVCPRCAMIIDAAVQQKRPRQSAGVSMSSPVVVPAVPFRGGGEGGGPLNASSSSSSPTGMTERATTTTTTTTTRTMTRRSPSPTPPVESGSGAGSSVFPSTAAFHALTSAAAAVLMPSHTVGEWRASTSPSQSRERDLERKHDTLRQLLAEEMERSAIRQKSYENDIQALVNEKVGLLKQVEILRRRVAAADDLGDSDFAVDPDKPLDGIASGQAEANLKVEDIKKERRLLKKSVNQLSHLLKREKAKREEVEQRLRDFSMEQAAAGSSAGGGAGASPTSPPAVHQGAGSASHDTISNNRDRGGGRGRDGDSDMKKAGKEAGSVSPDPKPSDSPSGFEGKESTPSWTSLETPHIPLTGPTGGTPGRWARSATPEEQEAQLSRWAEELFEKEELMRKMFECIQTRENQLRSFTDGLKRRSAQLMDLHATLFREERMVMLGEELDEAFTGTEELELEGISSDHLVGSMARHQPE